MYTGLPFAVPQTVNELPLIKTRYSLRVVSYVLGGYRKRHDLVADPVHIDHERHVVLLYGVGRESDGDFDLALRGDVPVRWDDLELPRRYVRPRLAPRGRGAGGAVVIAGAADTVYLSVAQHPHPERHGYQGGVGKGTRLGGRETLKTQSPSLSFFFKFTAASMNFCSNPEYFYRVTLFFQCNCDL